MRFAHEKVLGGNRFFVVFAGRGRSASGNAYSQSHDLEHKSCSHLTWRRTLVGFEMARDRFGEIVLRKDPRDSFAHVGKERASVSTDLCRRGRRRRRRGGGVRCSGTSTASETQAGKARRTTAKRERRKKGWASACGCINRPGRAAVRRREGSAGRRGRSGDVGCAARGGRSGRGRRRRGWRRCIS